MSEATRDLGASAEPNKVGPDYFAFYTLEVAELLSQDEDFIPFSSENSELAEKMYGVAGDKAITRNNYNGKENIVLGSLFCNPIGARLPDFKKERLKALLRQSVFALSQEVDEMLDPVLAIRRIQSNLRYRKSLPNYSVAACEGDAEQHPHKKIKLSSSIGIPPHASPISGRVNGEDSDYEGKDADLPEKEISNGVRNSCAHCHTTETSNWRPGPEGPEVNDDLQFLLENDAIMVEESLKKHSDELSATLQNMEQQLEEILDIVLSNCRLMTISEKQQLQKLIQKLPPRNLDRVVEIIRRNKPSGKYFSDEIHVDLEKEDNTTLWRLYYCVEAVENARKLSGLLNLSKTL